MIKAWLVGLIILLNASVVWSETLNIVVVGLFTKQAVLKINGEQRLLKAGRTSPEGVKLISATSQGAVLEINGVRQKYALGTEIGSNYAQATGHATVSLWSTNGMFQTVGNVNGYSVDFLVDTGASSVALNAATARRLEIDYSKAPAGKVKTASGTEVAYKVSLDLVQIGDIKLHNVQAMVIDGPQPERALLGMSFLGQLDIQHKDSRMDLKEKY